MTLSEDGVGDANQEDDDARSEADIIRVVSVLSGSFTDDSCTGDGLTPRIFEDDEQTKNYLWGPFRNNILQQMTARRRNSFWNIFRKRECFTGEEIALTMIEQGLCVSRHEAEKIGNGLMERGYLAPRQDNPLTSKPFQPDRNVSYYLIGDPPSDPLDDEIQTTAEDHPKPPKNGVQENRPKQSTQVLGTRTNSKVPPTDILDTRTTSKVPPDTILHNDVVARTYLRGNFMEDVLSYAARRSSLLSMCLSTRPKFSGEEAAKVLIDHELCETRHDAEILCIDLVQRGLIRPCADNPPSVHPFQADRLLYYTF
mmetsp:Transcript_345/g.600  ORF Transcript_345/g.600 Transcript_345/m.600 type:complete len:312 (-) Transcript_345:52-987(-)